MSANVVNWFEIYSSDFKRAKKFYTDVFKFELTDMPPSPDMDYSMFPSGGLTAFGSSGAIARTAMMKPGMGGIVVYFSTKEINDELGRVEAAGGKIIRPKFAIGEFGFIALVEDSEGNLIGLHSMQ